MSMDRRSFLKTTSISAALFSWPSAARAMGPKRKPVNRFDTPSFSAFIDTVIPGPKSDPTGAPGALEAGTLEYLDVVEQSKMFPISLELVHFIVTRALDLVAFMGSLQPFEKLNQAQREQVVRDLMFLPGAPFLLRLLRAPFYTASVNRVGYDYLGYPGANNGYLDFSFGEQLAWPERGSVGGNLP